jgi:hypothetical protein
MSIKVKRKTNPRLLIIITEKPAIIRINAEQRKEIKY